MASTGTNRVVTFDETSADRVLKATRAVESAGLSPDGRRRPSFSIVHLFRVTSATADADGLWDAVLQVLGDGPDFTPEDFLDENGATVAVKVREINA